MPILSGYMWASGEGGAMVCRVGDDEYTRFSPDEGNEGDPCTVDTDQQQSQQAQVEKE